MASSAVPPFPLPKTAWQAGFYSRTRNQASGFTVTPDRHIQFTNNLHFRADAGRRAERGLALRARGHSRHDSWRPTGHITRRSRPGSRRLAGVQRGRKGFWRCGSTPRLAGSSSRAGSAFGVTTSIGGGLGRPRARVGAFVPPTRGIIGSRINASYSPVRSASRARKPYFPGMFSSLSFAMTSASGCGPRSPLSRERTATAPASCSLSPTISM
jgi:hypothetical protein